jgi:gliding motility-associated-like protein
MLTRKLFLVLGLLIVISITSTIKGQSQIAIVLNEYSASNVNSMTGSASDVYGQSGDWVELYNAHTGSVSLASYYLSNDRNNLFKWQFPSGYKLDPQNYGLVWLSGKSGPIGAFTLGEVHANFTLEQCRGQWLILSTSQGVVRDSVFVRKAKAGHTWGRVDYSILGINGWKLFTQASQGAPNPMVFSVNGYCPTPKCFVSTATVLTGPNSGGFYNDGAQIVYFRLADSGLAFDTAFSCYNIYYTTNGDYPDPANTATTKFYADSANGFITIDVTTVLRAISVPKTNTVGCPTGELPSFCETNTYFIDQEYQEFSKDFGVVSIAMDQSQSGFFSVSSPPPATVHIEYYDGKKQVSEGYGIIGKPVNETWQTLQKGFYVTIDDERGSGCNFEGNIFNVDGLGTSSRTVFPTLHMSGGDFEAHSPGGTTTTLTSSSEGTGIRDVFYQSLATKYNLNVNALHMKPVVAFINGDYMGVYTLKEVYDKYYEAYYHKQSRDSLELDFKHGLEGNMVDYEGVPAKYPPASFKTEVYDVAMKLPLNNKGNYEKVFSKLDKASFIDYMILNSYAMNNDLFEFNVAFTRGADQSASGGKWHYYLWNVPAIFNFTHVPGNTAAYNNTDISPCILYTRPYNTALTLSPGAFNGHGDVLKKLMVTVDNSKQACGKFQLEFRNRYQDLLNGPLSCDKISKHYEYVVSLYEKEYHYHENPASPPNPGAFVTNVENAWDTNTTRLREIIARRCLTVEDYLTKPGCFSATGPYALTVDVRPAGAGQVKLNSIILDAYKWSGKYYSTTMSFKAIPTNTNYVFHHWEFEKHTPTLPASMDSVAINIIMDENVVAVFTDKTKDISNTGEEANVPTGFTPNGDGNNDDFKPVGAGEFANEYQMTIWNRWGQEVFRSVSPQSGWDGYYKGQQAITGVYAYVITYKNVFGESKLLKGNVTLTR